MREQWPQSRFTTAANAGVPADKAGLAAALLNASQQLGGALGLAVLTAVSTSRTNHLLSAGRPAAHALTAGIQQRAARREHLRPLRATNTRGESEEAPIEAKPEASLAA